MYTYYIVLSTTYIFKIIILSFFFASNILSLNPAHTYANSQITVIYK